MENKSFKSTFIGSNESGKNEEFDIKKVFLLIDRVLKRSLATPFFLISAQSLFRQ